MAATVVDLDSLMAAIALCRTATQTTEEEDSRPEGKPSARKGKHASSTGCDNDDDGASSEEDWVEADAKAAPHQHRRELQLLEDIKLSVQKLTLDVKALKKERQRSHNTSASSVKDKELEKDILSGMFPTTSCGHSTKIFYGNEFGHGLKCADCSIKVFRHKNGDMSTKVPKSTLTSITADIQTRSGC